MIQSISLYYMLFDYLTNSFNAYKYVHGMLFHSIYVDYYFDSKYVHYILFDSLVA
ncbi:hypothetical protein Lalb_Chr01g0020711 [Lupinus albus]|uniref:Uncharacterized protein n=1 Tax=Lupinus albus TaxID=3870 RepID=A0A6A4R844_LUPAL|nr:hypothetical protein Lalb_Chr01g0020711 [Lupinus albus]